MDGILTREELAIDLAKYDANNYRKARKTFKERALEFDPTGLKAMKKEYWKQSLKAIYEKNLIRYLQMDDFEFMDLFNAEKGNRLHLYSKNKYSINKLYDTDNQYHIYST